MNTTKENKTEEKPKLSVAEAGRKGGLARARKLTKARRSEIARLGYKASPLSVKQKPCQTP